ncbi:MAG: ribosome silencing factor, partial [Firmicutes bacterium]|nr:ribosome silencing factor [Bacillota bacterium]
MEVEELLSLAVEAATAKKATDPVVLATVHLTPVFDYFLICSAQTKTQVRAIADHLREELAKAGLSLLHAEGVEEAAWILLDYGWLVVHIMLQRESDFYQLERLWHDA